MEGNHVVISLEDFLALKERNTILENTIDEMIEIRKSYDESKLDLVINFPPVVCNQIGKVMKATYPGYELVKNLNDISVYEFQFALTKEKATMLKKAEEEEKEELSIGSQDFEQFND